MPFPDAVMPVIDVVDALSVSHAATGEAHKLGMKGGNGLSNVFSKAMSFIGICRHERHHIYRGFRLALGYDYQARILTTACCDDFCPIACPGFALCCDDHGVAQEGVATAGG